MQFDLIFLCVCLQLGSIFPYVIICSLVQFFSLCPFANGFNFSLCVCLQLGSIFPFVIACSWVQFFPMCLFSNGLNFSLCVCLQMGSIFPYDLFTVGFNMMILTSGHHPGALMSPILEESIIRDGGDDGSLVREYDH